jgi:hypothetical protein
MSTKLKQNKIVEMHILLCVGVQYIHLLFLSWHC